MSLTFWTPEQFQAQTWKSTGFLWRPYIPAGGICLLHGPGGASKSQLLWQLLNAVESGSPLFGQPVRQGRTLLVCVDMPPPILQLRFKESGFMQHFDLIGGTPFHSAGIDFRESKEYEVLARASEGHPYSLIAVDAIGEVYGGSANEDFGPARVYGAFRELFPHASLLFNHHDRKRSTDRYGQFIPRQEEDVLGSANWRNYATTALHLYPISESMVQLDYTKTQVARKVDPLPLYRYPDSGELRAWDYPTQALLAGVFNGLLLHADLPLFDEKGDLPELLERIKKKPTYKDMTLGQLTGIYFGWVAARGYEAKHYVPPYESSVEHYVNGLQQEEPDDYPTA